MWCRSRAPWRYPRGRAPNLKPTDPDPPDEEALEWYRAALVADAHADSLLWNRNLAIRSSEGHVDFPGSGRRGFECNSSRFRPAASLILDGMGAFCAWRGWPRAARRRPLDRALWQIEELHRAAERSEGSVQVVTNRDDLDAALAAGQLAAILGIEGRTRSRESQASGATRETWGSILGAGPPYSQ